MFAADRVRACALVMAAMLAASGCGTDGGGGAPDPIAAPGPDSPGALTATDEAVVDASVGFGVELAAHTAAADPRANVVLSPLGASMALGMTMNGAGGATFDAMRSALGFGTLTPEEINAAYRDLIARLTSLDPNVRLEIANAVWTKEGVTFHDAFLQAVRAAFGASTEALDFADPDAVVEINEWVAERTDGLIDSIVDALDPSLVMLLANAVYFEGTWTTQFDPANTRRAAFRREDGSETDVDMMSLSNVEVLRGRGDSYSAVELPYGDGAFAMVVVLPDEGVGARDWLAELDADEWTAVVEGLTSDRLNLLSIPKFTLTFDTYLNDALKALGMTPAFRPGADFTRMSPSGDQMCIDFVRQKTRVEVDERGTRAAAATGVGVGVVSFTGFVADRPFVFAIRERSTGAILFIGLVGDPAAEDPGPQPFVSECTSTVMPQ
ncbi:MAG TPA: serpin family protein [Gammaproteobacteria bacterium]